MRLCLLALLALFATVALAVDDVKTRQPKNDPSAATINGSGRVGQKATISSNYGGLKGAKNANARSESNAEVNKDGDGRVQGKTKTGTQFGIQRNRNPNGQKANSVAGALDGRSGTKTLNGALHKGKGAEVNTDTKRGSKNSDIQWETAANGQKNVELEAGEKTATAHGYGANGKDRFDLQTKRGGEYQIDPSTQTKTNGVGTINSDSVNNKGDGEYTYNIKQSGTTTEAMLKDAQPSAGRSGFEWTCTGAKVGSQVCKNARGETVGRSQVDGDGHARVYDKKDRLIGRGETEKKGAKHYAVNLNKPENVRNAEGLYATSIKNWQDYDCYREITKKNDPNKNDVKIDKPIKMDYAKSKGSNSTTYKFPDCFEMSAQLTLAPNVDVEDLALEFQVRVNPVGDYKCSSGPTCGRECYFCGACDQKSVRWQQANANSNNEKLCSATGGNRYTVSMTVCPPPEGEMPVCGKFDRSFGSDYWTKTKEETLISRLLVWRRPKAQDEIRNNFFSRDEKEGASFRNSIKTQAQAQGLLTGGGAASSYTDFELMQVYIRQQLSLKPNEYTEELLACQGGKADYDLAGSKVGGKFLVGAADTLKNKGNIQDNIYSKPLCKDVAEVQAKDFERLKQEWVAAGKPQGQASLGSSILGGGGLGNLGGGFGNLGGSGGLGNLGSLFTRGG